MGTKGRYFTQVHKAEGFGKVLATLLCRPVLYEVRDVKVELKQKAAFLSCQPQ